MIDAALKNGVEGGCVSGVIFFPEKECGWAGKAGGVGGAGGRARYEGGVCGGGRAVFTCGRHFKVRAGSDLALARKGGTGGAIGERRGRALALFCRSILRRDVAHLTGGCRFYQGAIFDAGCDDVEEPLEVLGAVAPAGGGVRCLPAMKFGRRGTPMGARRLGGQFGSGLPLGGMWRKSRDSAGRRGGDMDGGRRPSIGTISRRRLKQ